MISRSLFIFGGLAAVSCFAVGTAMGQYSTGFEAADGINASTGGTVLTGQDNYYIPQGTNSTDYLAYTYSGNALGIVGNPTGGEQFVAVEGPGSPTFGRAQRDITWGTGTATVTYDTCALYTGQPPSANNIGSFSVQPYPGSASYIHLFSWVDINNPTAWRAFYLAYDANGTAHGQPGMSPGPEWDNLSLNHWYHFETDIDFGQNRITEVRVTDLDTNQSASFQPSDWYLEGGQGGTPPPATGFRMFSGGGVAGNVAAFDNMNVTVGGGGFDLSITMPQGCPGPITVSWTGSPGQGQQALVVGNQPGSTTIPPQFPCSGTVLGVQGGVMLVDPPGFFSNQGGSGSISGNVGGAACGKFLQLVKGGTCETSDVEEIN